MGWSQTSTSPHKKRTAKIKLVPRGQRDRRHQQESTVKIKFVPRSPKDRRHQKERTAKNKSASGSKITTSPQGEHCKNKKRKPRTLKDKRQKSTSPTKKNS